MKARLAFVIPMQLVVRPETWRALPMLEAYQDSDCPNPVRTKPGALFCTAAAAAACQATKGLLSAPAATYVDLPGVHATSVHATRT